MYKVGNASMSTGLAIGPEGRILLTEHSDETRPPSPVTIVDGVLDAIEHEITANPSPWSGNLLGPYGSSVITTFSRHSDDGLEIKGVVCLCPASDPALSEVPTQTSHATANSGAVVSAVVTRRYRRPRRHEILLPSGIMSVHVPRTEPNADTATRPAPVHILPIARDIRSVARAFGAAPSPLHSVDVEGTVYPAVTLGFGTFDLRLLFPCRYPLQSPIALVHSGATIMAMPITWDLNLADRSRLASALHSVRDRTGGGAGAGG